MKSIKHLEIKVQKSFLVLLMALVAITFNISVSAQESELDKVRFVRDHFRFKKNGVEIGDIALWVILENKNGASTLLNQGIILSKQMDVKAKYDVDVNNYYSATSTLDGKLILEALGYPTLPSVSEIPKEVLELIFEHKFPTASFLLKKSVQLIKIKNLIDAVVDRGQAAMINKIVKEYIALGGGPDAEETIGFLYSKNIDNINQRVGNGFDLLQFCRDQFEVYNTLHSSAFQNDLNAYNDTVVSYVKTGNLPPPFPNPNPQPMPTPIPTPNPQPKPTLAPAPNLQPGDCAVTQYTKGSLNVRSSPSVNARSIGKLGDGRLLKILDGPKQADGYWWYQHNQGGWSVFHYNGADLMRRSDCVAPLPPLNDGTLVKEQSRNEVYVFEGGAKLWIQTLDAPGYSWDNVNVVGDGVLSTVSDTPRDGTLIREHPSDPVYVIIGGAKLWIWSLDAPGYSWDNVRVVPAGTLDRFPTVPWDHTLIREHPHDPVYVVIGGAKLWIRNLDAPGYSWDNVRVVPDQTLRDLPTVPRDGTLIREHPYAPVYVMRSGIKIHVCSEEAFNAAGYSWDDVNVVPEGTLSDIPGGLCLPAPAGLSPGGNSEFPPGTPNVALTWTPVPGAERYGVRVVDMTEPNIKMNESDCADNTLYLCLNSVTTNSFIIPVQNGHKYRWWVHAINTAGFSSETIESFSIVETAPVVPATRGDLDGDHRVSVRDLALVIDWTLSDEYHVQADLNNDGKVSARDLVALIDILLGQ